MAEWVRFARRGCGKLGANPEGSSLSQTERRVFQESLPQVEEDIAILIRLLRGGESLERGESRSKGRQRACARKIQDGFSKAEYSVMGQLDLMASSAAERNYADAHEAYMKLTLGNKTWHNTAVLYVSANTMQGAREYRRNRDDLNTYDVDPMAQKYMQAMRKIVHFAQCVQPNTDQSKNVML